MRSRGFTVMEILITVIIMAIIVAFAMPQYSKSVEQAYWRQARDILVTIYFGEKYYALFNGNTYVSLPGPPATWMDIQMDDPNSLPALPVTFSVVQFFGTFFGVAQRAGTGPCATRTIVINGTDMSLTGTWPDNGTCP